MRGPGRVRARCVTRAMLIGPGLAVGHLVECLLAKTCAIKGCLGDGTPFQGTSVASVAAELKRQGFPQYGKERLYCGLTGEPLESLVFIGPTYYQRLRHMVLPSAPASQGVCP